MEARKVSNESNKLECKRASKAIQKVIAIRRL